MQSALTDLRRTRRSRRLGDTEWFDLAYHVYLAGIFGGSAIIILSGYVGDEMLGESATGDVFQRGPTIMGIIVTIAIAIGLRSGAEGGPLSIEAADVRHLLLAPISRATVLRLPLLQRMRTALGGMALAGGVAGLLAAQRLPGTAPAWTFSGAAFGACIGVLVISIAASAHAIRIPGWAAIVIGGALTGWQIWAAIGEFTGPADTLGDLALWGYAQDPLDLVGISAVVVLGAVSLALVGRLSVEQLARRGDLVSQLRFAVTMQDLRTVVLLRRQLRQEQARSRPLVRLRATDGGASGAAIRRGIHGLARMPLARLGRIAAIAAAAGIAAAVAGQGTTPAILACGILLFVLGLDLVEPLSQEIDHPDRTDGLPRSAGWMHLRLLVGPVVLAVPAALVAAAACAVLLPSSTGAAFALAVPVTWAGMTGAIVNAVRDSVDPAPSEGLVVPPEMAGFKQLVTVIVPVVISSLGTLSILAVREQPEVGTVVRALIGLALFIGAFGWWVDRRVETRQKWRRFVQEAKP